MASCAGDRGRQQNADAIGDPAAPSIELEPATPRRSLRSVIFRGALWTTLAQLTPLLVNIALTPYLVRSLGVAQYGIYVLANSIVLFLGTFDGGVAASATRFSAVYAGNDDRARATRLVSTLLLVVSTIGAVLLGILTFAAREILALFDAPASAVEGGVFLLRTLAIVLALLQIRSIFAAQLSARQLYGWQTFTTITSYGFYAVILALTVHHAGLRGVAWALLAQAGVVFVLTTSRALRFLDRHEIGLMPRAERRLFLAYSAKAQATGLTGIISQQADTFIVARLLDISAVAVYGVGANFATQIRNVALNVLAPMSTAIAHAYGRGGEPEALALFTTMQRRWVQLSAAWCATAAPAVYFGIRSWLGPRFQEAGIICAVLVAAYAMHMWTGTLTALLRAVGRPGIEVQYATAAIVSNIVLTIPLVIWFGVIGTVIATAASLVIGSTYYVRVARSRYDPNIRSFFREVPILAAGLTIATVLLLQFCASPVCPHGGLGLIVRGLVSAPGFLVYAICLLGPSKTVQLARMTIRSGFRSRVAG